MSERSLGQVIKESILNDSRTAWNGEPERINSAYDAAALAVKAAIAKWPRCERCEGFGNVPLPFGTTFETDSADEIMDRHRLVACPACGGLGRVEND